MDPRVLDLLREAAGRKCRPYEERLFKKTVVLGKIILPETEEQKRVADECAKWYFGGKFSGEFPIPMFCDGRPISTELQDDYCGDLDEWLKALETSNFEKIHAKCENFVARFRKGFEVLSPEEQTAIRNRVIKRNYPAAQEYLPSEIQVILGLARTD